MIMNQLFSECLVKIPTEVRRGGLIQYAVTEKITDFMKLKGICKQEFAKKMHVSEEIVSK